MSSPVPGVRSASRGCRSDTKNDVDEEYDRDRDLSLRNLAMLAPLILALGGWVIALEGRLQEVTTKQEERGPRISAPESLTSQLYDATPDPSSKPETKVVIEALKAEHDRLADRVPRLEEPLNSLHNYILALPVRSTPYAPLMPMKRGDLLLDLPLDKGIN